jgi:ATP-binding cassette, subfamily B, bacterial
MSVKKKNPISHLFGAMWNTSDKKGKRAIVTYFSMFFVANAVELSEPVLIGLMFNVVQSGGVTHQTLPIILLYLGALVGMTLLHWMFHGPARVIEQANAFRVFKYRKESLISHVVALPLEWHTDHHSGDTIDRVEKGTRALYDFSQDTFQIFSSFIKFIIAFGVLAYFNIHATYIIVLLVAVTLWIVFRFDSYLETLLDKVNKAENTVSAKVYDIIGNISTIVMLRAQKQSLEMVSSEIEKPFALFLRWVKINELKWFLVSVLAVLAQFCILGSYVATAVYADKVILVGTLYLLYSYVHNIVSVFYNIAWLYSDLVTKRTKLANAEALEENPVPEIYTPNTDVYKNWRSLAVKNLSFTYHGQEKTGDARHLSDISFRFSRGEKIAFIGESGSGKTTMLKVLRGLYDVDSGTVQIGKKEVPGGIYDIAQMVALVPQDPEIFATTIGENITLGLPYSEKEMRQFSDLALFTPVAERLPKQFNSEINEKGVNLSGGEKQRLALARGLLFAKDRDIILLDEPTSSIDAKNERLIYENIFEMFKKKTVISTIHRLHMLPMFDTIYYFKRGHIVASGTFTELQKSSKEFRQLWQKYTKSHKE